MDQTRMNCPPVERPVIIEARELSVSFPVKKEQGVVDQLVLDQISLKIHQGEIIGLVGGTGSGKSVAGLALLGLVQPPGKVVNGQVLYCNRDLLTLSKEELRLIRGKDIGLILQSPHAALNPMMRIREQMIAIYRAHNNVTKKEAWAHSIDMLRLVGINDPERRCDAFPHELSGGMAQRVVIACALSSKPSLLIADEPSSGLDVTIQAQIMDDMWESVQKTGSAILLISKDLGIIANYCDRVVVMHDGKIVEQAPVKDFFQTPQHEYSKTILSLQREEGLLQHQVKFNRSQREATNHKEQTPVIRVDNLTKLFDIHGSREKIQAVCDVSFSIDPSMTLGLVGESGSGKTTTGRCVLRLEAPTSGEIRYRGTPIDSISMGQLRNYRSKLQIVFQNPFETLNPRWTVWDTLKEPLDLHTDLGKAEKRARILEIMDLVWLDTDLINCRPRELSAGRRQRVAIARALATNPEFVVLDEPTSALPPDTENEIIKLLINLQNQLGISYLYISHDLSTVKYICHQVAVMYLSQIVEMGDKNLVFNHPLHPYSQGLLKSVLFPDPNDRRIDKSRQERDVLKGEIPSPINLPQGCYLYGRCQVAVGSCKDTPQELETLQDGRMIRCWRIAQGELPLN